LAQAILAQGFGSNHFCSKGLGLRLQLRPSSEEGLPAAAMAKVGRATLIPAVALIVCYFRRLAFVPPAGRGAAPAAAAAGAVASLGAAPVYADAIGDAAKKLSSASYPMLKDVDWGSTLSLTKPGSASALEYLKAVGTAIDMGAAMDPKLLKAGVEAHHKAIGSGGGKACSQADFEAINAALGRMIASVPEDKVMAVYDAFGKLVSPDVPPYLMSTVKEADARAAYSALMEFKDVVKANPITSTAASAPSNGQIDAAAGKLAAAAYPFLKDIDWSSDLSLTSPGGAATPKAVLGAIDKALVMGAAMDGGALKEAALAHVKAIGSVDASGVTTQADFAAINAGLGKAIASVPASKVMDVYNAFGKVVSADVPNYLIRTVNAGDARAAYSAFMEFKDVVKASR